MKWTAQSGAVVPLHHHANEIVPPNVPHEFVFLEDTVDIDVFAPARQDWIHGTAAYHSK